MRTSLPSSFSTSARIASAAGLFLFSGLCSAEDPRREDMKGASPVTAIDADEIQNSGLTSVDDLVRLAGVTPGLSLNQGNTNLRGLGASVFLRSRYTASQRDDALLGDDETTVGFGIPRVEVSLGAQVTDRIDGIISFVTNDSQSGEFELENAFVNYNAFDSIDMQIGQFMPGVRREDMVHESNLGGLGRTFQHEFFAGEYQQGIQIAQKFDESSNWWWATHLTDGPRSINSEFDSNNEFDFSFGGRFEYRAKGTWDQFTDITAFRGTEEGLLIGLGGYVALEGETNPASVNDLMLCSLSGDVSYENDGLRLGGTVDWLQEDQDGMPAYNHLGWAVEGGVFVNDQLELFGRAEQICVDEDLGLTNDEFMFLFFGFNYFPIPGSHAARISGDIGYAFDETSPLSGQGVPGAQLLGGNADSGFIGSLNDGEVALRLQIQGRF